jgi:hypothetical protein
MANYEFVTIVRWGLPMQVPARVAVILDNVRDTAFCRIQAAHLDNLERAELRAALHTIARRADRASRWDQIIGPIILIGKRR